MKAFARAVPLSIGLGSILLPVATASFAGPLGYANASGGSASFYGQLSPTYLGFDDGRESYGNLADNAISNARVGFNLDQKYADDLSLRFNFETALGAPQSSAFSQGFEPIWTWEKTDIRHLELILASRLGKLAVGQGSMATDGAPRSDLSGTGLAGYVNRADSAGGYYFVDSDTGALSGVTIGNAFKDYNGGRQFRLRYDTPDFHGLSAAAAYGVNVLTEGNDNDYYDVAVNYGGDLGDFRIAGSVGWSWIFDPGSDATTDQRMGSVSVLHKPTGLNASVAAGASPDNGSYVYGKFGWTGDVVTAGGTAVAVDYYAGEDFDTDGSASESWGIEATQAFDKANLEVYAGWIQYAHDGAATDYDDASSTMFGLRWKF